VHPDNRDAFHWVYPSYTRTDQIKDRIEFLRFQNGILQRDIDHNVEELHQLQEELWTKGRRKSETL